MDAVQMRRRTRRQRPPGKGRTLGPRQEGMLWQRKMRTLALRLHKGHPRRDRSGAPMKRG